MMMIMIMIQAVLELKQAWDELENGVLLLHSNYYDVIDGTYIPIFSQNGDNHQHSLNSLMVFAANSQPWSMKWFEVVLLSVVVTGLEMGQTCCCLTIRSTKPFWMKFLTSPNLWVFLEFRNLQEYKHLTEKEMEDEEIAINGDIFSFFIDPVRMILRPISSYSIVIPFYRNSCLSFFLLKHHIQPVEKKHLLLNGRVILLCNMCEGCKQMSEHILESRNLYSIFVYVWD